MLRFLRKTTKSQAHKRCSSEGKVIDFISAQLIVISCSTLESYLNLQISSLLFSASSSVPVQGSAWQRRNIIFVSRELTFCALAKKSKSLNMEHKPLSCERALKEHIINYHFFCLPSHAFIQLHNTYARDF